MTRDGTTDTLRQRVGQAGPTGATPGVLLPPADEASRSRRGGTIWRWLRRLLVLALLAVGVVALRVWVLVPKPITVRVARVERGRVERTIANSQAGTLKVRRRAAISPETSGRVVAIEAREGDRVEAGAVLLRLDDETIQARLALARRSLEVAEATLEQQRLSAERSRRELERNRELARTQIISEDLLDDMVARCDVQEAARIAAAARVEQARAEMHVVETDLEKTLLRAPFAGVIAELDAELGEWITPSPPLFLAPAVVDLLFDPTSLYVSAPMDEVDAARIHPGQAVKITVDSHADRSFAGTVVRVAPYVLDVEEQNRTIDVEVEFAEPRPDVTLLPGTSADVEIVLEIRDDVLRIPTTALYREGIVLVVQEGLLAERGVQIGLRNWDFCEIVEGMEDGEPVVAMLDRSEIEPGALVEIEVTEPEPEQ